MRKVSGPVRAIAAFLAFALIHVSFGSQAWAQVVNIGAVNAPVGGSAAAAAANVRAIANAANPIFSNAGLTSVFSAPAIAPAPSPSAVAAALTPKDEAFKAVIVYAAPQTAASETSPSVLAAGPRTGRIAHKSAAIISGVRAFFDRKSAENVPASLEAGYSGAQSAAHASELKPSTNGKLALQLQSNKPPTPPQQPKAKSWFGLGGIVAALIGGMLVMQLGVEAKGAAMAQLTEDSFGDFSILAQVTIFASIGSMIGQQLSESFSAKFGLTTTFYAAEVLRAVSLGAMVFLLGTGMMPLPLMFVFYALNGIVSGVADTAEGTLRKFILAEQGVSQKTFRTWWQLLAEIVAVPAPMALGALVATIGAGWITALYPAAILAGLMLFLMLKVIPWETAKRIENRIAQASATAETPAPIAPKLGAWERTWNEFKRVFANMEEGKDFVFKNAALKYSLAGSAIFGLMNILIYGLIAPGYGKLIAGSAGMAVVQGNLVGMFSLGGLLFAAVSLILERLDKKKNSGKSKDELAAAERRSMLRWTMLGIPALGLLGVMAFNLALPFAAVMFMGVNWVPSTMLAAMLIPFGFMQVGASIALSSYFQERLPADSAKVQKALAFSGSATTALSIVLMLALKPLFGDIAAFNPFPYIAAGLIPLAAAVFFIQRKLSNATEPENLKFADIPPGKKTAGGFAGLLLGVITAALLLSFMALIPGMTGVLSGLGVLGKFALHLGTALALPTAGWFADRAIRKRSSK